MDEIFDFTQTMTTGALQEFADLLTDMSERIGFRVSSRGWCYLLEQSGAINKDQFSRVETWVNRCRRQGLLPIDFVAEEASRDFSGVETPSTDTPVADLKVWLEHACRSGELFNVDWWRNESWYIQMVVEKIDLVTLFEPVCATFHIPIANSKGWSSMLQRAEYARRFKEAEAQGMNCLLLYCGDHDPAGLQISDFLRKNLRDLQGVRWVDGTEGYDPTPLTIKRFGLNYDFIRDNNFTWIDNLITGGGKDLASESHRHHYTEYVQRYLANYGARKCEANVLVTQPELARTLCTEAIEEYLGAGALVRFSNRRRSVIDYLNNFDTACGVLTSIRDAMDACDDEANIMQDNPWDG